ncbi:MAG: 50S ribosomal protein L35 [Phycisphaerae bacterium]|nr:50S ribosomal protein L35 [Phycisphaerae bacterium]
MPKMKTHKGLKKRFRVSARGKVKHRRAFTGHLMSAKSGRRRRRLRRDGILIAPWGAKARRALQA